MTDLAPYNTFKVPAKAKNFLIIASEIDIPKEPFFILGEGANVLLIHDQELVVKNEIKGRQIIDENDDFVTLKLGSGENWIDLVNWTVEKGWSGIENMALIPGTVGAAAVGNIAAYGENFEDVCVSVKAVDPESKKELTFSKSECQFGYRESFFSKEKDKFFVTAATIKLSKKPAFDLSYHELNPRTAHASLQEILSDIGKPPYTPKQIAQAVTKLRIERLPDWKQIGTAGSFFKSPIIPLDKAKGLQKEIANLQTYPAKKLLYNDEISGDFVKIPAARLFEELGWRGRRIGNVGVWPKHALTVVNYGGATGEEILDFTNQMKADIQSHFDIDLEEEVQII